MIEIWKDIKGYDGNYQVSNYGKVRSLEHYVKHYSGGLRLMKGRILKLQVNKYGYYNIRITYKGIKKTHKLHILVWEHFGDKSRDGFQVDHIKEKDKLNNRIDNLQLLTNRQNGVKSIDKTKTTSKYVGVRWHKSSQKWISQIQIKGKSKYLGSFNNEYDAYLSYKKELEEIGD